MESSNQKQDRVIIYDAPNERELEKALAEHRPRHPLCAEYHDLHGPLVEFGKHARVYATGMKMAYSFPNPLYYLTDISQAREAQIFYELRLKRLTVVFQNYKEGLLNKAMAFTKAEEYQLRQRQREVQDARADLESAKLIHRVALKQKTGASEPHSTALHNELIKIFRKYDDAEEELLDFDGATTKKLTEEQVEEREILNNTVKKHSHELETKLVELFNVGGTPPGNVIPFALPVRRKWAEDYWTKMQTEQVSYSSAPRGPVSREAIENINV